MYLQTMRLLGTGPSSSYRRYGRLHVTLQDITTFTDTLIVNTVLLPVCVASLSTSVRVVTVGRFIYLLT